MGTWGEFAGGWRWIWRCFTPSASTGIQKGWPRLGKAGDKWNLSPGWHCQECGKAGQEPQCPGVSSALRAGTAEPQAGETQQGPQRAAAPPVSPGIVTWQWRGMWK